MQTMIAIIGVLVAVIGALGGGLAVSNNKRKQYKKEAQEQQKNTSLQKEITEVIAEQPKRKTNKKDGVIKALIILLAFSFIGCAHYAPVGAYLVKIEKPSDFKDINYQVLDNDTYLFDDVNISELIKQTDWCSNTLKKYEAQIDAYNKYNGGN